MTKDIKDWKMLTKYWKKKTNCWKKKTNCWKKSTKRRNLLVLGAVADILTKNSQFVSYMCVLKVNNIKSKYQEY